MIATQKLGEGFGIASACRAPDVPRATSYRRLMHAVFTVPVFRRFCRRKLSDEDQAEVKALVYNDSMVDKSPYPVFAKSLDDERYPCSIRSTHRILAKDHGTGHRRQFYHPIYTMPELLATGPDQIWSWDVTKLVGSKKWNHRHLYVIPDIHSRQTVFFYISQLVLVGATPILENWFTD